jgi:hypothetical protein
VKEYVTRFEIFYLTRNLIENSVITHFSYKIRDAQEARPSARWTTQLHAQAGQFLAQQPYGDENPPITAVSKSRVLRVL